MQNGQETFSDPRHAPSFGEAFRFWLKLGFISFGGPAGQIAIMHEFLVEKQRWISEARFLHALNYCMILPGPEAQQLATYIGWLLHGIRGGIVAGLLFILPSVFILLGLSIVYVKIGTLPVMTSIFFILKPAVIAIIVQALVRIGKRSLKNLTHVALAVGAFVLLYFFNVPFPVIILGAFVVGIVFVQFVPQLVTESKEHAGHITEDEHSYVINEYSSSLKKPSTRSLIVVALTAMALWTMPFLLLRANDSEFWSTLIAFFTKAALITFGGAYAVLPYVAEVSVDKFHWLTNLQMVDGLALGESTPGPLIMVLAFVGFMAGYHQYHSIWFAALSLGVTTYYTFLPSFVFILAGAPWVEKTKENSKVKNILSMVTAAITGVILNLTVYLAKAVFVSETTGLQWLSIAWLCVTFAALQYFRVNLVLWIVVSVIVGIVHHFVTLALI